MPFFSDSQIELALDDLKSSTHSALTSLLAMLREKAPLVGAGKPIPFGSKQERSLLERYSSPSGGPDTHPFYIPFHADQGKSRWRDTEYPGRSLQRQRSGLREIFVQDATDRKRWSLATDYVARLLKEPEKVIGNPPISLPSLATWMLRAVDHQSMATAVETLIAELRLDRDGLIGTAAVPSVFTREDGAGIGDPSSVAAVGPADLLRLLAARSAAPDSSAPGFGPDDVVIDPDSVEASWDFDPELLRDIAGVEGLYEQAFSAAAALRRGKNVVFVGPPGTAKTTLAEQICKLAGMPYTIAPATEQWTTFETIGGYFMMPDDVGKGEQLDFLPGVMVESIIRKRCLIIDEFNRADIDKAFGEMFTLLTGQSVTLAFKMRTPGGLKRIRLMPVAGLVESDVHGIAVPGWWRIIGAMNVSDKGSIKRLSGPFKRRFAMIAVPLPAPEVYSGLLRAAGAATAMPEGIPMGSLVDILIDLFAAEGGGFASIGQPMGPAIPLSMIASAASEWTMDASRPLKVVLNSVLESEVAPLISLPLNRIDEASSLVAAHIGDVDRFAAALETWIGR